MTPATVALLAALAVADGAGSPALYDGRAGSTEVAIPRIEAVVKVDGRLDEAVWDSASRLTGFSQYAPVDGAPAAFATDVLVWYSPTAIYFGIRADAPPGTVHATLADRDRIDADDSVQIYLGTYADGRQSLMFAVNPLGVQADGTLVEGGARNGGGGFGGLDTGRPDPDLSEDFVFESKGRLTDRGYEVEVRIPFKTLRYQSANPQDWDLHIIRRVQSAGHEYSWAPARRAAASFLGQAGKLRGLTDLHRGLVLDVNPAVTGRVDGAPRADEPGSWRYRADTPDVGANVRWGVTPNLTLNGTVNPDFSQVESDAGQFVYDPRDAVYFSEKRPFFLDGLEQFTTPNDLIYTRRIVAPLAAAKLTGKVAGTGIAVLSAVDDASTSASGRDHPVFNVIRVQRDIGGGSKIAAVYTDRLEGADFNRVAGADAWFTFANVYSLQLQAAASDTRRAGDTFVAPLWQATLNRSGRRYGLRASLRGVAPGFRAGAGFVRRAGVVQGNVTNQISLYGRPGSRVERWNGDVSLDGVWQYDAFTSGRPLQDWKLHLNSNFTFRGGWRSGQSLLIESFGYDNQLYAAYRLLRRTPAGDDLLPFTGTPHIPNLDYVLSIETPRLKGISLAADAIWGRDENFFEWASAGIWFLDLTVQWRPTERLRVDATYQEQGYRRRSDDSIVGRRRIPRLKAEYQLSRPIFLRVVSQYDGQFQADLRDASRTELPIVVLDPLTGAFVPALGFRRSTLRTDFLFSYQPTPGTVVFAGYGNTLSDPRADGIPGRARTTDGFFAKVSYLFRF